MKFLVLLGLVAVGTNALRVAEQKHNAKFAWYTYDESFLDGKCLRDDNQCDGLRTCSS